MLAPSSDVVDGGLYIVCFCSYKDRLFDGVFVGFGSRQKPPNKRTGCSVALRFFRQQLRMGVYEIHRRREAGVGGMVVEGGWVFGCWFSSVFSLVPCLLLVFNIFFLFFGLLLESLFLG